MIEKRHYSAAYAFGQVMHQRQQLFRNVADPYLKERVRDLFDIERTRPATRAGADTRGYDPADRGRSSSWPTTSPPSQAISFDRRHILGFAINVGGQTAHMTIIARMLGIPAVVALNDITSDVTGGEMMIVDGSHGIVIANPDSETVARYHQRQREYGQFVKKLHALRDEPAVTRDGVKIELQANIEVPEETSSALAWGADGIGLYRTELLFLSSPRIPSEEQQYDAFREVASSAGDRPVVIRTIDLGADKLAPGMGPQHDHNPALGLRSVRYCLLHLDMFKTHLRAILRASVEGNVRIMFPMISTVMELRQAKATLADVMEDLDDEGVPFRRDVPVGMMIETPAAAMLSNAFVREVDFVSIGSNDLTQYTLAVDRANERVAHLFSAHNPAVIKLVHQVIRAARRQNVDVGLCGEMAGTPIYCQLLLGMGLRRLSMAPADIPGIKRVVRNTTMARCQLIARRVARFDSDRQVLNFLRDELRNIDPDDEEAAPDLANGGTGVTATLAKTRGWNRNRRRSVCAWLPSWPFTGRCGSSHTTTSCACSRGR